MRSTYDKPEPMTLVQALAAARLAGHHGSDYELDNAIEAGDLEGHQILQARASYRAGQEARKAGQRCMCIACTSGGPKAQSNERRRYEYGERRSKELMDTGMSWSNACKIIDEEIANGAAF